MTETAARAAATAWLHELVEALSRVAPAEADAPDDGEIDRLLAGGLALPDEELAAVDPMLLGTLVGLLSAARSATAGEIAAVHRQRIDVDRTVKAITAYVRALA